MLHLSKFGSALGVAAFGLFALSAAQAQTAPAFYSGTFQQDDNHAIFSFDVVTPGFVTLYTTSYGGGLNVDGSATGPGGFDPVLTLFDSSGAYIAQDDDDSPFSVADPVSGAFADAGLIVPLDPGTYQVFVTQADNYYDGAAMPIPDLTTGFTRDGQGNFTGDVFGNPDGSQAGLSFIDNAGTQRTSFFTLNINSDFPPAPAAVPEASTTVSFGLLLALGLGGVAVAARKKARASAA